MRENIYYWKCDCAIPAEERSICFTDAKYDNRTITAQLQRKTEDLLGEKISGIKPLQCAGDHYAFRLTCKGVRFLLRASVNSTDDDYMLAESALCRLAAEHDVPVPCIVHTEAEPGAEIRWQLIEWVSGGTLAEHARRGLLDEKAAAEDLGRLLCRLHSVGLEGFGFINTELLSRTGRLHGLHTRYIDYFSCCLDRHLAYTADHGLIAPKKASEAGTLLLRFASSLKPDRGVLVHRDPAWWNLLGTPSSISALIDWDDAVSGDPADDLAMLRCFHSRTYTDTVEKAYFADTDAPEDFEARIRLHWLRNMLWKTVLRHQLGYFKPGAAGFIKNLYPDSDLEKQTRSILEQSFASVRSLV